MMPVKILISLFFSIVCALYLGCILPLHLPRLHTFFDRKPFNCRPCFTFHCTWLAMAVFAWLLASWQVLLAGIVAAFVLFAIVRYIDNKKMEP
ncbi:hypothetical protein [Dysgonomonas sp. 25]|uniref:hypothetical protein n=1 Tax=Dysgonomonas sp. 25 TaxID=2302933 RepID=UPI0013CFA5E7|nr:hypothetical protein [Dysgonomonas sp. 25]NDV69299.1 hypothetical protein [Dysgonomonas sp. 25]